MPERPLSEIKPDRLEAEVLKGTDEICVCRVNVFQEPADPGDIAKDCPCISYQQPKPRLGLGPKSPCQLDDEHKHRCVMRVGRGTRKCGVRRPPGQSAAVQRPQESDRG